MQKLDNSQKVYVTLPKEDYTESATQEINENNNSSWIENFVNKIYKIKDKKNIIFSKIAYE